ncbi:hypothetical protein [Paenibacillus xylanilyticus]|uniref:Uncharacterized protein n=1 Tax=Paenibacillus xylanilyticus TaxID=248903 RepID=A0A7Y6C4E5_9BACL|nr:hypothetical protein [Paenibacillus xylanilyticus]NUU79833.1 hypothetical protein [Paenibacillus xylanilyticus]
MNEEEALQEFGLEPGSGDRERIRRLLQQEFDNTSAEDNDYLKTLCIMLFAIGHVEDTQLIWQAKRKNQDTGSYVEVQLLCGAGFEDTIMYLEQKGGQQAGEQLQYLRQCEAYDFVDFSKEEWLSNYKQYYDFEN